MSSVVQALTVFLPVTYLIAAGLSAMGWGGERAPRVQGLARSALALVVAMHIALFLARGSAAGGFPRLDLWASISAVALGGTILHALVTIRMGERGTEGFVLGLICLMQFLSSAFGPLELEARDAPTTVYLIHVFTALLATSAVMISGIHGVLYLVLLRQMRRRQFGLLYRQLPDLEHLTQLSRRAALAGFLLLSGGVNFGIWKAHALGIEGFSYTDPAMILVLGVWIHFGAVAFSGKIMGFNAKRAAAAAAAGFVVLVLAFLISLLPHGAFHLSS